MRRPAGTCDFRWRQRPGKAVRACVFGSGIVLAVTGPGYGGPREWAVVLFGGRSTRLALLLASLLTGLVIALLTVHLVGRWR
jgi:hypothetical protein